MKISGTNKNSKCIYCGLEIYGNGCVYSPCKVHLHIDDSKKCIYCGSTSFGPGCPYNPHGKNHVHGVDYSNLAAESVHKSILAGILLVRLFEKDLDLNNPLDFFLEKIVELIGKENLEFIKDRMQFNAKKVNLSESAEQIQDLTTCQFEINENVKTLLESIKSAYKKNISKEIIDNLLIDSVIRNA